MLFNDMWSFLYIISAKCRSMSSQYKSTRTVGPMSTINSHQLSHVSEIPSSQVCLMTCFRTFYAAFIVSQLRRNRTRATPGRVFANLPRNPQNSWILLSIVGVYHTRGPLTGHSHMRNNDTSLHEYVVNSLHAFLSSTKVPASAGTRRRSGQTRQQWCGGAPQ